MFSVQAEMSGALEAAEKATGPTLAVIEGASREVTSAVMEVIRGVAWPACNVGDGGL